MPRPEQSGPPLLSLVGAQHAVPVEQSRDSTSECMSPPSLSSAPLASRTVLRDRTRPKGRRPLPARSTRFCAPDGSAGRRDPGYTRAHFRPMRTSPPPHFCRVILLHFAAPFRHLAPTVGAQHAVPVVPNSASPVSAFSVIPSPPRREGSAFRSTARHPPPAPTHSPPPHPLARPVAATFRWPPRDFLTAITWTFSGGTSKTRRSISFISPPFLV